MGFFDRFRRKRDQGLRDELIRLLVRRTYNEDTGGTQLNATVSAAACMVAECCGDVGSAPPTDRVIGILSERLDPRDFTATALQQLSWPREGSLADGEEGFPGHTLSIGRWVFESNRERIGALLQPITDQAHRLRITTECLAEIMQWAAAFPDPRTRPRPDEMLALAAEVIHRRVAGTTKSRSAAQR